MLAWGSVPVCPIAALQTTMESIADVVEGGDVRTGDAPSSRRPFTRQRRAARDLPAVGVPPNGGQTNLAMVTQGNSNNTLRYLRRSVTRGI